jgi:hypothetical protein
MKSVLRFFLYGAAIWLAPFALGMSLIAVVNQESALFDTIMAIALGASAAWFSLLYLRRLPSADMRAGAMAGVGWAALAAALDAPVFMFGPYRMLIQDYVADIGLGYILIPIISASIGHALAQRSGAAAGNAT